MELWPVLWRGSVAEFRILDGFGKKGATCRAMINPAAKSLKARYASTGKVC